MDLSEINKEKHTKKEDMIPYLIRQTTKYSDKIIYIILVIKALCSQNITSIMF